MLTTIRSEVTKEKLGVEILKASVDIAPGRSIESPPITATELVQEFDILCRNSDETGLGCFIKAVNAIKQKHEDIHGRLSFNVTNSSSQTPRKIGEAFFHTSRKAEIGQHFIDISGGRGPVKVRLSDSSKTMVRIVDARLGFDLSQDSDQDFQGSSGARSTAANEASVLLFAFDSICEQVLERMEFRSLDEAPYKLAEAVLEILKIPSSAIVLTAVSLAIHPVHDAQTLFRAQASWEIEPNSSGNALNATDLRSNHTLGRGDKDTIRTRSTTCETSHQTRRPTPISHANVAQSIPTKRAAADISTRKSMFPGLSMVKRQEGTTVLFNPQWIA